MADVETKVTKNLLDRLFVRISSIILSFEICTRFLVAFVCVGLFVVFVSLLKTAALLKRLISQALKGRLSRRPPFELQFFVCCGTSVMSVLHGSCALLHVACGRDMV